MKKRTKIVATISDKNASYEFIKKLYEAGMDVVRLNTAHQTPEDALKVINIVRQVSDKIAIMLDTKGPEIRTNKMDTDIHVDENQIVEIKGDLEGITTSKTIYVSYSGIVNDVPKGSKILIDDGALALLVTKKTEDSLICKVLNSGLVQSRKSVNIPSVQINLPAITQKDIAFISFAAQHKLDFIAHSFVRKAADIIAVQSILDSLDSKIKIIAKIENNEGVENIDSILEHAYGVMVARGDLALEISLEKLPVVQKMLVTKCVERRKTVIVATQMLHTMIENPRPTRAEVNDIANAIYEGTDALMLSGETAYGKYAVESVEMMSAICHEVEANLPPFRTIPKLTLSSEVARYLVWSAVESTATLPIKVIIADTTSGTTVRALAAYRGRVLIQAQCYNPCTVRMLALTYGVYADYIEPKNNHREFESETLQQLLNTGNYHPNDLVLIVAGSFGRKSGTTFIEIGEIDKLMHNHD